MSNSHATDKKLTGTQKRKIRRLAISMCANYGDNLCLPADRPCPMVEKLYSSGLCTYFKKAVLPLDPQLEAELTASTPPETKECDICKSKFIPMSNRQVYCSKKCEDFGNRIKSRERMKKMRENKRGKCYDLGIKKP